MAVLGALPADLECRPIREDDWEGVIDCLRRGFPTRDRDYWARALTRQSQRPAVDDLPRYGIALAKSGQVVGVLLSLYTRCLLYTSDHMNYTAPGEYAGLREAGVVCVVMPALDFAVSHTRPFDARSMMDAGLTLALATDMCPGCWLESMPFVVQLACRLYKFSPAEAIRAGTIHAAMALNRADRIGSLEPGKQADIAIFPFDRYEDMAYRLGRGRASLVIKAGRIVFDDRRHPA